MLTKKNILNTGLLLLGIFESIIALAQRGSMDYDYDEDEIKDFNRYAHFGLSTAEWWSVAIGIILILIAREIREKQKGFSTALYIIGFPAVCPLILVILAVAQKLLGLALMLGTIVGVLYLLFGKKS